MTFNEWYQKESDNNPRFNRMTDIQKSKKSWHTSQLELIHVILKLMKTYDSKDMEFRVAMETLLFGEDNE